MKKVLSCVLAIALLFSLGACTHQTADETPTGTASAETTGGATAASIGTKATEGGKPTEKEPETTAPTTCEHDYVIEKTVDATCTEEGYTLYLCTKCGDTQKKDVTEKLEHVFSAKVTQPTTKERGYTTFTCEVCGYSYQGNYVDQLKEGQTVSHTHHYRDTVVAATCTKGGYTMHKCDCGESYIDAKTPAKGHAYKETIVLPSCTASGYTNHVCGNCGDTYISNRTSALGHSYGEWKIEKEATTTSTGLKARYCTRCNDKQTETIPVKTAPTTPTEPSKPTNPPTQPTNPTTPPTNPTEPAKTPEFVVDYSSVATIKVGETKTVPFTLKNGNVSKLKVVVETEKLLTVSISGNNLVITGVSTGYTWFAVEYNGEELENSYCELEVKKNIPKATGVKIYYQDAPFYDGVNKYVGDYVTLGLRTTTAEAAQFIKVTSNNPSVVSVSSNYSIDERDVSATLNFNSSGSATITITTEDGECSYSYTIYVNSGYGYEDGEVTPERFCEIVNGVLNKNGIAQDGAENGGWNLISFSQDELTGANAVYSGKSIIHSYYQYGNTRIRLEYKGMEDGFYQFYLYRC